MSALFLGCDTGRYSTGCVRECHSCKNKNCDAFNGSCVDKCPDPNALTESCIGEAKQMYAPLNIVILQLFSSFIA